MKLGEVKIRVWTDHYFMRHETIEESLKDSLCHEFGLEVKDCRILNLNYGEHLAHGEYLLEGMVDNFVEFYRQVYFPDMSDSEKLDLIVNAEVVTE